MRVYHGNYEYTMGPYYQEYSISIYKTQSGMVFDGTIVQERVSF